MARGTQQPNSDYHLHLQIPLVFLTSVYIIGWRWDWFGGAGDYFTPAARHKSQWPACSSTCRSFGSWSFVQTGSGKTCLRRELCT